MNYNAANPLAALVQADDETAFMARTQRTPEGRTELTQMSRELA